MEYNNWGIPDSDCTLYPMEPNSISYWIYSNHAESNSYFKFHTAQEETVSLFVAFAAYYRENIQHPLL